MKKILFLLVIVLASISCKVKEVFVYVPEIHTEYKTKIQKDSVYLKDSIYIHQKGDTIFSEKFRTKYIERIKNDTVLKNDTIFQEKIKIEIKEVNRLNWLQKTLIYFGISCFILLLLMNAKKIIRFFKGLI